MVRLETGVKDIKMEEDTKKRLIAYYELFSSPNGKKVLEDLEEQYQMKSSVVSNDPYGTIFNEGCRFIYLLIRENMKNGENIKKGNNL